MQLSQKLKVLSHLQNYPRNNFFIPFVFFFFLFFVLAFFQTKGIILYDEGYILTAAQRIVDGQIVYRDFDFAYMPEAYGWLH